MKDWLLGFLQEAGLIEIVYVCDAPEQWAASVSQGEITPPWATPEPEEDTCTFPDCINERQPGYSWCREHNETARDLYRLNWPGGAA